MKLPKLAPDAKNWYRLASVWWILILTALASINGFIGELREYFNLSLWATMGITALTAVAGVLSRILQFKGKSDEQDD